MEPFDLLGPLPAAGSTTALEASAGTGKTFALAGLVTRYLAEGTATLDEMLLITFSRAATRELRERIREQLAETAAALDGSHDAHPNELVAHLLDGTVEQRDARRVRLRDALTDFDAATIATTHQFCQLVLKSLGVTGDTAAGVTLVDDLDEMIVEIVDDVYLTVFGAQNDPPKLTYEEALRLGREVIGDPAAELRPSDPEPGTVAGLRLEFAEKLRAELELRKRQRLVLGYDDLLSRLAAALQNADSGAPQRLRQRWPIVMVDEFQDTDPVQWEVISRAFRRYSTLILIGDPKQAIYGFRGGDIHTYLQAAQTAGARRTLAVNWRSDQALVDSVQVVLRGAALGHPDIVVRDIAAHRKGHRLAGAPRNAPFRLRVATRKLLGSTVRSTTPIDRLRRHIRSDLAGDIAALVASGATVDGSPVGAGDIGVLVERRADAVSCQQALTAAGIPAVHTGESDVVGSAAGDVWLCLLEAFDQTHRSSVVRAAATTVFFGRTVTELATAGDALTDEVAATLRDWADHARTGGPAAVFEAAKLSGMSRRVLEQPGGERMLTDLTHLSEVLQDVAHREHYTLPALREWLRHRRDSGSGARDRNRRLDSDAEAVQVMTVWGAKGLQFPIVYLPFSFNRHVKPPDVPRFHDDNGVRCKYVGGKESPDHGDIKQRSKSEEAGDNLRLIYVALTRAQSQVIAWWAPSQDEPDGGLSRLLRGRGADAAEVPDRCVPATISDEQALALLRSWEAAGGPVIEESVVADSAPLSRQKPSTELSVRHFDRAIDTTWRRTSYSALIRGAESRGPETESDDGVRDDESGAVPVGKAPSPGGAPVRSPMADLPTGAVFGSLVHGVLETADPAAPDLAAELTEQAQTHAPWWAVDVEPAALAAAMVPMHDTPLGPLAHGLTLRDIGVCDRLRELDFELPLAGGDRAGPVVPEVSLSGVGELLGRHLPPDDPLAPYADRLRSAGLGDRQLRGYLAGSVDVMLRLPGQRYLVADYKTNHLGDTAADYNTARLTAAMLHSDYPLQALLYAVVQHRFLRWRRPGYDPDTHLGGVLYLFVRGMCGPETPVDDGHPAGVFSWRPPAALVVALSKLLDAGRAAA